MDLAKVSLQSFMCEPDNFFLEKSEYPEAFHYGSAQWVDDIGETIWDLGGGYAINASLSAGSGDPLATYHGTLVGYYSGEGLAVDDAHWGHGLGPALVITAAPYRNLPPHRRVTAAGDKALRRAWRIANGLDPAPWPLDARRRRFQIQGFDAHGEMHSFDSDDIQLAEAAYAEMQGSLTDVNAWQNP